MKHLKTQNSAPVYERWLDFMQFRNLLILNFVTFMLLLGMIGTHDYRSYHKTQLFLLVLNLVFAVFLCLKKGFSYTRTSCMKVCSYSGFRWKAPGLSLLHYLTFFLCRVRFPPIISIQPQVS